MPETIPGGAYQQADGSWKNAKGERIPAPKGAVYVRPEVEPLTEAEVTPGAELLRARVASTGPGDEYEKESETITPRRGRKAKGED